MPKLKNEKARPIDGKEFAKKFGITKLRGNDLVWDAVAEKAVPANQHPFIQLKLRVHDGELKTFRELMQHGEKIQDLFDSEETVFDIDTETEIKVKDHPKVVQAKQKREKDMQELMQDPNAVDYKRWVLMLIDVLNRNNRDAKEDYMERGFINNWGFNPMPRMWLTAPMHSTHIPQEIKEWQEKQVMTTSEGRREFISQALSRLNPKELKALGLDKSAAALEPEMAQRLGLVPKDSKDRTFVINEDGKVEGPEL